MRNGIKRLRYSMRVKRHPRSLSGLLRLWWHDFVIHPLFEGGERCQDCGRDYVLWRAPDDLYEVVIGSNRGLFCPACFDRRSRRVYRRGVIFIAEPFALEENQ